MRFCNSIGVGHSTWLETWDPEDRAKALAQMAHEAETCSMCGTAPWEWDPKQGGSKFAYEAVGSICGGCERKDWYRDEADTKRAGLHVVLQRPEGTGV